MYLYECKTVCMCSMYVCWYECSLVCVLKYIYIFWETDSCSELLFFRGTHAQTDDLVSSGHSLVATGGWWGLRSQTGAAHRANTPGQQRLARDTVECEESEAAEGSAPSLKQNAFWDFPSAQSQSSKLYHCDAHEVLQGRCWTTSLTYNASAKLLIQKSEKSAALHVEKYKSPFGVKFLLCIYVY